MKITKFLSVALLLLTGMVTMVAQEMPPIPIDKAVRIGHLDNGLTYYIRHNNWPEQKANFYIAQRVGSIQENDDQRGLAHFLEHMAFNGSEHFPDSSLLAYTRSLGVEFGSDLNAYTSIDQTVYRICNVPTKRGQAAIDSCILILKDWSNGLTLDAKEIDKERGVIHQEWQLNEGPGQRMYQQILPKMYPGSKYGERLPIGLMEIVDNFPPEALRAYYKKWYRPDNQAIIVVGDIDVDKVEATIKSLWANSTVPADAAQVVPEMVPNNNEAIYVVARDKEQQYSMLGIMMKHETETREEKLNADYLITDYAKDIVALMLGMRLEEATQKPDCPLVGASAYDGTYGLSATKDAFQIDGYAKEGQDLEGLKMMYRELLRVKKYGFKATEYNRAKAEWVSQLEKRYANRNRITNASFGNEYRDHYLKGDPIPSIEEYYMLMTQICNADFLNVDVINDFARDLVNVSDSNLVVMIMAQDKEGKVVPTEAEMAQAIAQVRAENIEDYVDNVKDEPLIAEMPKKGSIKSEKTNKAFGYTELTLSNGARVILKHTDFKEDEVLFQASAKGGKGFYGEADFANLKLFSTAINASGLGSFSNTELTKALYGKQASVSMDMGNYYRYLAGRTVPKDIETLMQLIYLNFTAINRDDQSFDAVKSQIELALQNKNLSPESAFSDSITLTIYGHEKRYAPVEMEDLKKADYGRILDMARERFANANNFVFHFVGNFDEKAIRPLIEQYIASLPGNGAEEEVKEIPGMATGKVTNHFRRKMDSPKAMAVEVWHMPVEYTAENKVMADAAGQVLSIAYLKDIREDASAAYSVGAQGELERINDKVYAMMQAYCPMDPAKAETALNLLNKDFNDQAEKSEFDYVQMVKENMLKNIDTMEKTNGYWLDVIDEYIFTGVDLHTGYKAAAKTLSGKKVTAFFKNLRDAGNHIEVVMLP